MYVKKNFKNSTLLVNERISIINKRVYLTSAITSISTNASFGRRATSTHERAGLCAEKYSPYTSFIAAKSSIFLIKTVVFITVSNDAPASFNTAWRFLNT